MEIVSRSQQQTASLAAALAAFLHGGDIVFLIGELGAGKTFFIRSAAEALGVTEPVTSPSYTMAQTYGGKTTVHHLDLYRLPKFDAGDAADFEPFFEAESITFIEWPDRAVPFLGEPAVVIRMEHVNIDSRRISIESNRQELIHGLEHAFADSVD
ncbi:MAG: tRNA (adenosine(37)-N6)-threonylcarbamoyltransferase complex ATPase subunit type 1 TsaE [Thermoleophilia bacterium]